jgi:hypothetical protein
MIHWAAGTDWRRPLIGIGVCIAAVSRDSAMFVYNRRARVCTRRSRFLSDNHSLNWRFVDRLGSKRSTNIVPYVNAGKIDWGGVFRSR